MFTSILRLAVALVVSSLIGLAAYAVLGRADATESTATRTDDADQPDQVSTTAGLATNSTTPPASSTSTSTTLPARGSVIIQGTGDVNLDPAYTPVFAVNGYEYAWSELDGLFLEDDLTVVNLECAPTDVGIAERKEYVFRCPTESLASLAGAGVEAANMGNNHSGDYGREALIDGRAQLLAAGVAPVGAGADAAQAGLPAVFEIEGWRVAVVGFGGVFPHPGWFATADTPGMRNGDDIPSMIEAVEAADDVAEIVVVTIHWGVELDTRPRTDDVERARAMIEAGADVIFGHHPHRLQPYEIVDGSAVFWSLGNFVWPRQSIAGATTGIARAIVHPDGTIDTCLIPAFIENSGQPMLTDEPSCAGEG